MTSGPDANEATESRSVGWLRTHALGQSDFLRLLHDHGIPERVAAELVGLVSAPGKEPAAALPASGPKDQRSGLGVAVADARPASRDEVTVTVSGPTKERVAEPALPLWRAIGPVAVGSDRTGSMPPRFLSTGQPLARLGERDRRRVAVQPLIPVSRLGCVLRHLLREPRPGTRLDEKRLVAQSARRQPLTRLPRETRPVWSDRLRLCWDESQAVAFARQDLERVYRWLVRWRGEQGLELLFTDGLGREYGWARGKKRTLALPDEHTLVLGLSDLGAADQDPQRVQYWRQLAEEASHRGARLTALVLCPASRWPADFAKPWVVQEWERVRPHRRHAPGEGHARRNARELADTLITLLSPTLRVEPALLRAARRLLSLEGADLGTELDFWLDSRVYGRSRYGAALRPEARTALRQAFQDLAESLRNEFEKLIRSHHEPLSPLVCAEELLACGSDPANKTSVEILEQYARRLNQGGAESDGERLYIERLTRRQSSEAWQQQALAAIWALSHRNPERTAFTEPLPEGLSLDQVAWALVGEPRIVRITQRGDALSFDPVRDPNEPLAPSGGSHVADLPLRGAQVQMRWSGASQRGALLLVDDRPRIALPRAARPPEQGGAVLELGSDEATVHVAAVARPARAKRLFRDAEGLWVTPAVTNSGPEPVMSPGACPSADAGLVREPLRDVLWPPWASGLDQDDVGLVATLVLFNKVAMRLRWIPAGTFVMGSPKSEMGRNDSEGPEREVEVTRGFWLGEMPCTQEQWEAVMGSNPSHFRVGSSHPVEQVSWDDCQQFCERLREQVPGLEVRLPTEAEWEYACRAGQQSAYNDGSECTKPEGKDPALEKLGWYGENSGGHTQAVGQKDPNRWGLYDMHGNVYEWCGDFWADRYSAEKQRDPTGPASGLYRVIRGGCWSLWARRCRSASRDWNQPGYRRHSLGFRLAAVH